MAGHPAHLCGKGLLSKAAYCFDRRTLEEVGGFGRIGHYAGEFVFLHTVAASSKGDLYTAEVGGGRRVQKFVRQRSR